MAILVPQEDAALVLPAIANADQQRTAVAAEIDAVRTGMVQQIVEATVAHCFLGSVSGDPGGSVIPE